MWSMKLVRGSCAALALGLMLAMASPTPAHATEIAPMANTADRSYNFQLYPKGDKGGTQFYRKDNSSSVYVHIKSRSGVHRMYVDGAKNENGSGWKDCTATTYRSRKVGQWRMRNYVNERGFPMHG